MATQRSLAVVCGSAGGCSSGGAGKGVGPSGRPRAALCNQRAARGLMLGQVISLFVAGTGIFSQYLARRKVFIPTTQSTLNYVLLSLHLVYLWYRNRGFKLNVAWWRYLLLAVCDVEANYFVVKAYQYTSITSVMLIDCFTIPCVMVLSSAFLKAKYRPRHLIGVALCVVGLAVLVASDATYGNNHSSSALPHAVVGDLLCMLGSLFYAISNVGQESIVKQYPREEYLGMIGGFGMIISLCQLMVLERTELSNIPIDSWSVWALVIGFVVCLFAMYTSTSVFLRLRDSALFNLSLLTSDIWALLAGVLLFGQHLGWLYFVAYTVIVGGLLVYNSEAVLSNISDANGEGVAVSGARPDGFSKLTEEAALMAPGSRPPVTVVASHARTLSDDSKDAAVHGVAVLAPTQAGVPPV